MRQKRLLLLLVLLLTATTGAWAQDAKHLITATYDKQTRSLEQPLPYATTIGALYEAVTGESFSNLLSSMSAVGMPLTGIGSNNTSVVSIGELNGASTPVTVNADGKATVGLNFSGYVRGSYVSVVPPLYAYVKDGVKDADKWTVKVGEGQAQALPIGGLKGDGSETITLKYTGRLKVKGVTATVEAPAATPTLAEATAEDYGKVVCAAGHLHDAKTAVPDGCTAVGILGKVTETGHGLILALQNATEQEWETINGWTSVTTYAGTTLKVLPDDAARGSLTSYTKLGETAVSNWAVAQKSDYEAIFENLGSTQSDGFNGTTYDDNVNDYITIGVDGLAILGFYWSATEESDYNESWNFYNYCWTTNRKSTCYNVRPVLGFGGEAAEQAAGKPAATVTTAPTGAAIVGVGKTTALVSGGVADGGTLMYAVTTTNTMPTSTAGFSDAVPTAKDITASGTVYVWYYVKGDDTHSDSEIAGPVSVTVAPASTTLNNTTTAWTAGTYAVPAGGLTYGNAITVSGDVTLTLTDGETLTLNKGISLASGATLTVEGNGTMNINGTNNSTASTVAGSTGTLILTSGTLTATGGKGQDMTDDFETGASGGAAINGSVTVNGGSLTAKGGNGGNCIGDLASTHGGAGGAAISGDVTITDGAVAATGGNGGSINGSDAGYDVHGGAGGAAIGGNATLTGGTLTTTQGANGTQTGYFEESSVGAGGKAVAGTVTDNR